MKKKIDQEKLNDFFEETQKHESTGSNENEEKNTINQRGKYLCPKCRGILYSRNETCPHCGYKGYIPMSNEETRRIRWILFIIIAIIAILVFIFK